MKRAILSIMLALVLCMTCAFVGCGNASSYLNKKADVGEISSPEYKELTELEEIEGYDFDEDSSNNGLWAFYKIGGESVDVKFYDAKNLKFVDKEITISEELAEQIYNDMGIYPFGSINENTFFLIDEDEDGELVITAYGVDGKEVVSEKLADVNFNQLAMGGMNALIRVGSKVYQVTADTFEEVLDNELVAEFIVENFVMYYDGYFYSVMAAMFGATNSVTIYDKDFNATGYYKLPANAEDTEIGLLDNGNLLVQYRIYKSANDRDYDVLIKAGEIDPKDGQGAAAEDLKYDLHTVIVKAKGGVKEIDVDYEFTMLQSVNYIRTFNEEMVVAYDKKVKNIAQVYPIVDGRLDSAEVVAIDNNGKIVWDGKIVAWQNSAMGINVIGKGLFEIFDNNGKAFVVNAKGKVIVNEEGVNYINEKFYATDKAIYDFDGKVLVDLKAEKLEVVNETAGVFFLEKTDGSDELVYYFDGSSVKSFGEEEYLIHVDAEYFVISTEDGYVYYNGFGTKIDETDIELDYETSNGNATLLYNNDAETVWYVLK